MGHQALDKIKIAAIGDSHSWHGWLHLPYASTFTRGAMTMYAFGRDRPKVITNIIKEAIIVFCWGEIDCRCHVHKHPPWKECIDGIVKNYLEAIRENVSASKDIRRVWIFNVVPPPRRDGKTSNDTSFPFLGTDAERLQYVKYMNELLSKSEFPFLDVYNDYADEDGFLNMSMSDGHVHIRDVRPLEAAIIKKLEELKL